MTCEGFHLKEWRGSTAEQFTPGDPAPHDLARGPKQATPLN